MNIGSTAAGAFNHAGGTTVIGNQLTVGGAATGALTIGGGTFFAQNVNVLANGSITHTDGSTSINHLTVTGAGASMQVSGGTINGADATFNDGTIYIQSGGELDLSAGLRFLGSSSPNITGGTLKALTIDFTNQFVQDGGVVHTSLRVGNSTSSSPATYNLKSGTFQGSINVQHNGIFTQTGGVVGNDDWSFLNINAPSGFASRYELQDGTLNRDAYVSGTYIGWDTSGTDGTTGGTRYSGELRQTGGAADLKHLYIGQNGVYTIAGGASLINGTMKNYGTIDFASSTATLTAGSASFLDFSHGQLLNTQNATITGLAGSLMNFAAGYDPLTAIGHFSSDGLVHINGQPLTVPANTTVHGSGTIEGDVVNDGTLSPGNSPGELDIVGNLTHAANANVLIELAGNTSDNFDRITVTGAASLQGSLSVALLDDYLPAKTDSFTFLTAGSIQGNFANALTGIDFAGGHFDVTYSPTAVTLSNFTAVPEPATIALLTLAAPAFLCRRKRPPCGAH